MTRRSFGKYLSAIMALIGLTLLYTPIITLIFYSFLDMSGERGFDFAAYLNLLSDEKMFGALGTSISIAALSASISTLLGGGAAFALERGRPIAPRLFSALTLAPMVLPEVVFGLGLLIWFVFLRISLGWASLILAHITFSISYVALTVRGRVRLLDPAIDDAARDLGAGPWQVFLKVQLPLMAPALIAGWMMAFTLSFDDFLISFFTSGPETVTLPMALYGVIKFGVTPEVFAMASCIFAVSFLSATVISKLAGIRHMSH